MPVIQRPRFWVDDTITGEFPQGSLYIPVLQAIDKAVYHLKNHVYIIVHCNFLGDAVTNVVPKDCPIGQGND